MGSSVRDVLTNPKYTGYMVWNRRATKKGKGKHNPPSEWVWSSRPMHEPLVTRDLFDAAQTMAVHRERSRTGSAANRHPATKRTYELRSYVFCDDCQRRMHGKTRRWGGSYFACEANPKRDSTKPWFDHHPRSLWVREEPLQRIVHDFFATRIFGPDRQALLTAVLADTDQQQPADTTKRQERLQKQITELQRRRSRLPEELESSDQSTTDEDTQREYRHSVQERFADLTHQTRTLQSELEQPDTHITTAPDIGLLDRLPQLAIRLESAPEPLRRNLYEAFQLTVTYSARGKEATLTVTITEDQLDALVRVTNRRNVVTKRSDHRAKSDRSPGRSLLHGAPGGTTKGWDLV